MSEKLDPADLIDRVDTTLRRSFGIDPLRDHDEVCALATTGYVVSCWRNTVLEEIHSGGFVANARRGSYARDGIPDRDMARINIATWVQVRPHVHPRGIDVMAVRELLRDRSRPLRIGSDVVACGSLFQGAWTKLSWHVNEGCWLPLHLADRAFDGDESAVVRYYAVCGGAYASAWFGNPWWTRAISAWADEVPPPRVCDLDVAVEAPNELSDDAIGWLMSAHYRDSFLGAIKAWKTGRGVKESDLALGIWFPPGVPELPLRLQRR